MLDMTQNVTNPSYFVVPAPGHYGDKTKVFSSTGPSPQHARQRTEAGSFALVA